MKWPPQSMLAEGLKDAMLFFFGKLITIEKVYPKTDTTTTKSSVNNSFRPQFKQACKIVKVQQTHTHSGTNPLSIM